MPQGRRLDQDVRIVDSRRLLERIRPVHLSEFIDEAGDPNAQVRRKDTGVEMHALGPEAPRERLSGKVAD